MPDFFPRLPIKWNEGLIDHLIAYMVIVIFSNNCDNDGDDIG